MYAPVEISESGQPGEKLFCKWIMSLTQSNQQRAPVPSFLRTAMTCWSQRDMKALAQEFSIRHPGESRGPDLLRRSRCPEGFPAFAGTTPGFRLPPGMTNPRIPRRDFQVKAGIQIFFRCKPGTRLDSIFPRGDEGEPGPRFRGENSGFPFARE
jgi:hypothetical protein